MRRSASASQAALSATSAACAGSAEIDGMRSQASRSACRSSRWARTYSRSGLLLTGCSTVAPTVAPRPASVRPMPGELLRVDVGDLTFDVRVDGPEDGRPVLLLHGFPETSRVVGGGDPAARRGRAAHATPPTSSATPPAPGPDEVGAYSTPNLAQVTARPDDGAGRPASPTSSGTTGAPTSAWALAAWHPDRVRSLTAVSVPHPAAYTVAYRADPEQKERSGYIRLFWQAGKAEEVLLADDARRLRRMLSAARATPGCRRRRSTSTWRCCRRRAR